MPSDILPVLKDGASYSKTLIRGFRYKKSPEQLPEEIPLSQKETCRIF